MILRDNPVLGRELLVNLRAMRTWVFQFLYITFMSVLVIVAWPTSSGGVARTSPEVAQRLFDLVFLAQFFLIALVAPAFASGCIAGEKERKTYEMLLASPLSPATIVIGKLLSSLTCLVLLIVSTLPLMMLCLLLGGILLSEVVRTYLILVLAAGTFGLISLACSSVFRRTSSALLVSYLAILPLAMGIVLATRGDNTNLQSVVFRNFLSVAVLPPWTIAIWALVGAFVTRRLLRPPDVGSEGKEVVNEEDELKSAIGVVIDRDLFPDKLFAPAKRTDLMPDGLDPVLDKELRSEIFSQGTLMLRIVIQMSMALSIGVMAVCLFFKPEWAAYYVGYVILFNLLVGPVFAAGSITQERERKTLGLLVTTLLTPGQIVWAKLLAALRVSTVLTLLLTEQMLLAFALIKEFYPLFWALLVDLAIVLACCLTTTTIGLMCSAIVRRTVVSLVITYLMLLLLFVAPVGAARYIESFVGGVPPERLAALTVMSPFAAAFSVPVPAPPSAMGHTAVSNPAAPWVEGAGLPVWAVYLLITPMLCFVAYVVTYWAFRLRGWSAAKTA